MKWLLAGSLIVIAAAVLSWYLPDLLRNNRKLEEMKRAFEAVPTPPDTEQLIVRTAFGLLEGNGSHCDYFVGALYRSASPPDSVREHYAARVFLNPVSGNEEQVSLNILTNRESWNAMALPSKWDSPEAWGISNNLFPTGTVFLVSVMRSYEANRDCRCH